VLLRYRHKVRCSDETSPPCGHIIALVMTALLNDTVVSIEKSKSRQPSRFSFFDFPECSEKANSRDQRFHLYNNEVVREMSIVYRIFGKVQDTLTRAVYGVEKQTSKMSFYSCVDKKINGDNITVRRSTHHLTYRCIVRMFRSLSLLRISHANPCIDV
jgi:hypothetical protein